MARDDEHPPSPRATRREWLGLAVIALPCLLYSMDLTVLNLALPRISEDLRPSAAKLLWIVDIYGFFVAGWLVTMGTLGDRIGRRRLLLAGAAAFGAASVVASLARSADTLIAARAVLGVAGATLAPSTLSLIRNMFLDPRERRLAIGVWISSYSAGGAIGPLLGGLVLQFARWNTLFLLGVPVMLLLLAVGPVLLPEFRDPKPRRLDVASAALSLLAVLSAILGLKLIVQDGVGVLPVAAIVVGLALGVVFVRRQKRLEVPLIDLSLFRAPAFSASLATYLCGALVTFGSYVVIGQYLQLVLGQSPLIAGLWMLPGSFGFIVGSLLTPALARRVRPRTLVAVGFFIASIGFASAARLVAFGAPGLVVATIIYTLAMSPAFTLGTDFVVGAAPPEQAGAAAAISETGAELGGALGVALLGSVGTAVYRASLSSAVADVPPAALDTLGGATVAASKLPSTAGAHLLGAARAAFTHGLQVTVVLCAAMCVVAAIAALVGLPRGQTRGAD